jgi:hypothetical protein
MNNFLRYSIKAIELVTAVVFLAGAVLKALDINTFCVQISAYGVIENKALLPPAALATLMIETFLGMALLTGLRLRGLLFAAYEALLAVFTGLIMYGWVYHDIEDCGCFGALEMSPGISIAKNIVLAALVAAAWIGHCRIVRPPAPWRSMILRGLAAVLAGAALTGYAYTDLEAVDRSPRPFAQFVLDNEWGHFNLGESEYLVVMLSMDCEHCVAETPALLDLMLMPDVPKMLALCLEENEGGMEQFQIETGADFPMFKVGPLVYFNLIGDDTFRVYYVRGGRPVTFWDGEAPDYGELLEALETPA